MFVLELAINLSMNIHSDIATIQQKKKKKGTHKDLVINNWKFIQEQFKRKTTMVVTNLIENFTIEK